MRQSLFVLFLLASLPAAASHARTLVLSAGSFADWHAPTSWSKGGFSVPFIEREVIGGHPGEYLRVAYERRGSVQNPWRVDTFWNRWPYHSPQISEEIRSLRISQDVRMINGSSDGIETGLMLTQGGIHFINRSPLLADADWSVHSSSGLVSSDFAALVGIEGDGLDPNFHPDFSGSGYHIEFGFYIRLSVQPPNSQIITTVGLDNWRVEIDLVPEPAAFTMAGAACLALATLRRRNSPPPRDRSTPLRRC